VAADERIGASRLEQQSAYRLAGGCFAGGGENGDRVSRCPVGQRSCRRALEAVVLPAALDAVTLQLTLRRLLALPMASVGLAAFFAAPFTRQA
jgi:hypothetical protein